MPITNVKEWSVVSFAGASPDGGHPDGIANKVIAGWGMTPLSGSQEELFKGARLPEVPGSSLRIKTWSEGPNRRFSLLINRQPVPQSLDRGKVLSEEGENGSPGDIVVEGVYLFRMTLKCVEISAVVQQPASLPTPLATTPAALQPTEPELALEKAPDGTIVIGQVLRAPLKMFRRMATQPRKFFTRPELIELGEDLKRRGQLRPAIVKDLGTLDANGCRYELVAGERRWRACEVIGLEFLNFIIQKQTSDIDQFMNAFAENNHAVALSLLETVQAVEFAHKGGKSYEEIAHAAGKKTGQWAYQMHRLASLDGEVLKLLGPETPEDKQLALTTAQQLVGLPVDDQRKYALMASKSGMTTKKLNYLLKGVRREQSMGRKSAPSEEFMSVRRFFSSTNEQLEMIGDFEEFRILEMLKGRTPEAVSGLMKSIKDVHDNSGLVLKAFQDAILAYKARQDDLKQ